MPTLDVSYRDLCNLIGTTISEEELKTKAIMFAKGEIDEITEEGDLKIDEKDTNRPDLWSAEGVAREIAGRYGGKGLPEYHTESSGLVVNVDESVSDVRPYTVCAVVRNMSINDNILIQMIQLQEKIAGTYGRNRQDVAIGIYDFNKIKGNISYKAFKPDELKFAPLEFDKEMTLKEILEKHPKGEQFGHLLEGMDRYPIFIDDAKEVLSMPPVINSNYTGKVSSNTTDLFIECSGFELEKLKPALNVIVCALADRGGKIQTVDIEYADGKITTPNLSPGKITVKKDYIRKITGLDLSDDDMKDLLRQARYEISRDEGNMIEVLYPAYRQDIMHERDIVEDILISKGYNDIEPEKLDMITKGSLNGLDVFSNKLADLMIGMGFQEILSYTLTNKDNLFDKMNMKENDICELENPVSLNWSVFRNRILPGLLEFFSKNKHHEIPQKVFEIGKCIIPDNNEETRYRDNQRLACALTAREVSYEYATSMIYSLMTNLGLDFKLKEAENPSFIKGRCARIMLGDTEMGIIGEINPQVLNNWDIENPVVGFEIDVDKMFGYN